MSQTPHYAIILGETMRFMSAIHDGQHFTFWKCSLLNKPTNFNLENQINTFRNDGFNVFILYDYKRPHIVSAIPQDSYIPHTLWIVTCSDYMAAHPR